MQKRLSFIVPVYNVRDYVIRCLTALVNQNIPATDYEIIVVNDGSSDDSLALVTEFAQSYSNIQIINQENQGVSVARNRGFEWAGSQYIWFIDSDDWITQNCLKDLLAVLEENQLDMLCVGPSVAAQADFDHYFSKEKSLSSRISGKEALLRGNYFIAPWCYIFRKELLSENKIQFMPHVRYEDEEYIPRVLYYAKNVMNLTNFSVYFYYIWEGMISKSTATKLIFDKLVVAKSIQNFAAHSISEKELKEVFRYKSHSLILSGFNDIALNKSKHLLNQYIQTAKQLKLYPFKIEITSIKRSVLFILWNIVPGVMCQLKKR
ncbi:hypothetical protein FACS189413_08810 [Bacteroidia bacterium]|nr:hypothetical protein FACS189413_08810 [Bacteroidia bacterium]